MRIKLFFIILILFISSPSWGAVIFSDNFDSQADWTMTQSASTDIGCFTPNSACGTSPPTNWHGYYNGMSYLGNAQPGYGVGYNNIYIDAIAGYPYETSSTCRGGSGKCLTFWDEAVSQNFVNSDGQLILQMDQEYSEIYIRFYIKFGSKSDGNDYSVAHTGVEGGSGGHKLNHATHYLSGVPWQYFTANEGNQPGVSGGFQGYGGAFYNYMAYRCYEGDEGNHSPSCAAGEAYYCQGTPAYSFDVGCDLDQVQVNSNINSTMLDGNWHRMEYRLKMNTVVGTANGIYQFWYDTAAQGSPTDSRTAIPFSQVGAPTPVRGFRLVSIGGNNNYWFSGCTGAQCEQWYAIDDLCISDSYIGDAVCEGAAPSVPNLTGVTITGGTVQ
jgi:hypothetical protein